MSFLANIVEVYSAGLNAYFWYAKVLPMLKILLCKFWKIQEFSDFLPTATLWENLIFG